MASRKGDASRRLSCSNTTEKLFIIVAGFNSAGKSTVASRLARDLNLPIMEFGDIVRHEKQRDRSLPDDLSESYLVLRERHGDSWLASWAQSRSAKGLIMVGVRDKESCDRILEYFPSAVIVFVVADSGARYSRDRGKIRRNMFYLNPEEFALRDVIHDSWGLGEIYKMSQYIIDNNGSQAELDRSLAAVLQRFQRCEKD